MAITEDARRGTTRGDALRVVIFAGGRGAATLIDALSAQPRITLTVLVNTYDDGLSTGELRRVFPAMLGPSDVRKNASLLARRGNGGDELLAVLDRRLPADATSAENQRWVEVLADALLHGGGEQRDDVASLRVGDALEVGRCLRAVLDALAARPEGAGAPLDFRDMAVGNLVFAGAFLEEGSDFNRAVARYARLLEPRARIFNVTDGTPLVLVGLKETGAVLPRESAIVGPQDDASIRDIYLLSSYPTAADLERWASMTADAIDVELSARACDVAANPEALEALEEAHLIIYGPGTQHSSLFPSYLTHGVREAIVKNRGAAKVFIANLASDHDIQSLSVGTVLQRFRRYLARKDDEQLPPWEDVVDRVIAQRPDEEQVGKPRADRWLSLEGLPAAAQETIHLAVSDWTADDGRHAGGQVLEHLRKVVHGLDDVKVAPFRHRVSIIVPTLDEVGTLGRVLHELAALELGHLGVGQEIIVVDGGSTDGSLEVAGREVGVRTYQTAPGSGRGAALRLGIEKARGDIIVFFPSDGEYDVTDIPALVTPILENRFRVVFGTRAMRSVDLDEQSHHIYGQEPMLAALSKYGGITLSIAAILLYNRFVSDPLSSVKAFDADLLRSLGLKSDGVDLETELIARLAEERVFILETPVTYRPRRRDQGKKTRAADGLLALARLVRMRLRR